MTENKRELKSVINRLFVEEDKESGIESNFKSFAYSIKDNDEKVLGGIAGYRVFDEIYVNELCIDKSIRGQGLGKKLLETVEREVNDGTCENITLDTVDFQNAVGFYKKCGFEIEFVRKHKDNKKLDKYYMIKKL
ncbi:MAG: GNAT family N-acetyltransferase [Rickettsiales bacterium]|jgi:ribosomal protein S18 acetylase RimI-like enzyme|nr:GNAT family N-acetyltransferase [Rickettsiales bacterium]